MTKSSNLVVLVLVLLDLGLHLALLLLERGLGVSKSLLPAEPLFGLNRLIRLSPIGRRQVFEFREIAITNYSRP